MTWLALAWILACLLARVFLPAPSAPVAPGARPYQVESDGPLASLLGAAVGLFGLAAGLCWLVLLLALFLAPLAGVILVAYAATH